MKLELVISESRFGERHHHLQDALDVGLATQAHFDPCFSTFNKVIISCRTHYTSASQHKHIWRQIQNTSTTYSPTSIKNTYCTTVKVIFSSIQFRTNDTADIYLLKVNNRNTRPRCEICSKLTIKIVSLLLTLNIFHTLFKFQRKFHLPRCQVTKEKTSCRPQAYNFIKKKDSGVFL